MSIGTKMSIIPRTKAIFTRSLLNRPASGGYYVTNLPTVSSPVPSIPMIIVYLAVAVVDVAAITAVLVTKRTRRTRTQSICGATLAPP